MKILIVVIVVIWAILLLEAYVIREDRLSVLLYNLRVFHERIAIKIRRTGGNPSTDVNSDRFGADSTLGLMPSYKKYKHQRNEIEILKSQFSQVVAEKENFKQQLDQVKLESATLYSQLDTNFQELKRRSEILETENKQYQKSINGFWFVDKDFVATPFCLSFEAIISKSNNILLRVLEILEYCPEEQTSKCLPHLIDTFQAFNDCQGLGDLETHSSTEIIWWYVLLKSAQLLPKELKIDMASKSNQDQLSYLRKYSFENYLRIYVSNVIQFMEHIRCVLKKSEASQKVSNLITEYKLELETNDVTIDYVPIGSIISDAQFVSCEVEAMIGDDEHNRVISFSKYAVNSDAVGASHEKTKLKINM
jgi:hypothetical protein